MNRNVALFVSAVLVLGAALATAALVPGVLEEPTEDVRPSQLDLRDDTLINDVSVPGDTVTLQFENRLEHRGGPSRNVTVEVRAIDAETGLLEDRTVTDVGTIEDEREVSVLTNLTVARSGGYRIETVVYEDGRRVEQSAREISGVGSLTPEYARSTLQFHRGGPDQPAIFARPVETRNNRTVMNVTAQITNTGSEPAGDVTVRIRARQAESNVIAEETRIQVGSIRPGRTVEVSGQMTVPSDYNYWLDGSIVRDGVILRQRTDPANLNPQRALEADEQVTDVPFDAGDFVDTDTSRDRDREYEETPTAGEGPGFGAVAALAALLAAALIARRQTNE